MTGHDHNGGHRLAFCKQCDIVYCNHCSLEWGNRHYGGTYYYPWWNVGGIGTPTYGTTTVSVGYTSAVSHANHN